MNSRAFDILTILGPTATGKTSLAVAVASQLGAELISADSRQVFRGMNIGTGKDLCEYILPDGSTLPYHLIDIRDAGTPFSLYDYVGEFYKVYTDITARGRMPLLTGGTGLYIETVLAGRHLHEIPPDDTLRGELTLLSRDDLWNIFLRFPFRPQVDYSSNRRLIRAIEIACYYAAHPDHTPKMNPLKPNSLIVGIDIDRPTRNARIEKRLKERLEQGMIEEVRSLLEQGISEEILIGYGLEYRFVTRYLRKELTYNEMEEQLAIAIRQFSKRQMTWFRGMERRGFSIHWIDGTLPKEDCVEQILSLLQVSE